MAKTVTRTKTPGVIQPKTMARLPSQAAVRFSPAARPASAARAAAPSGGGGGRSSSPSLADIVRQAPKLSGGGAPPSSLASSTSLDDLKQAFFTDQANSYVPPKPRDYITTSAGVSGMPLVRDVLAMAARAPAASLAPQPSSPAPNIGNLTDLKQAFFTDQAHPYTPTTSGATGTNPSGGSGQKAIDFGGVNPIDVINKLTQTASQAQGGQGNVGLNAYNVQNAVDQGVLPGTVDVTKSLLDTAKNAVSNLPAAQSAAQQGVSQAMTEAMTPIWQQPWFQAAVNQYSGNLRQQMENEWQTGLAELAQRGVARGGTAGQLRTSLEARESQNLAGFVSNLLARTGQQTVQNALAGANLGMNWMDQIAGQVTSPLAEGQSLLGLGNQAGSLANSAFGNIAGTDLGLMGNLSQMMEQYAASQSLVSALQNLGLGTGLGGLGIGSLFGTGTLGSLDPLTLLLGGY